MGRGKFLRSLSQRWWLLFLLVVPVTLGTLVYIIYSPTQYEGFMTLADRRDRDVNRAPLFPDQMLGGAVNEQEIRLTNLATTLGSDTVLTQAFDQLLQGRYLERGPDVSAAKREFYKDVEIRPMRGSEFLQVTYVADEPVRAEEVIKVLLTKFIARFKSLNDQQLKAQIDFLRDQVADQQNLLDAKLQELREYKEATPEATAYQTSTSGLVSLFNMATGRHSAAERSEVIAAEAKRIAELQKDSPETLGARTAPANPLYAEVQRRLEGNRTQMESLRKRYGENHPVMIQLQESMNRDEELLEGIKPYFTLGGGPMATQPEMERRLAVLAAERQFAAAGAEKRNANAELARLQVKLDRLPVVEKTLALFDTELIALQTSTTNLRGKLEEARIRQGQTDTRPVYLLDDPQVRILDKGIVLKTLVAFFLSLVVAISLIASLGQFDQATYTAMEAENSLGFPVIATLPRSGQQRLNPDVEEPTPLAAAYQILSTQIMSVKERLAGPGILVASAEPDTGRTTVAANLAMSLSRDGARVLLVDADLRSPSLHGHFGLENRAGLAEILTGEATIEDVVQPTGVEGLLFIAAGQPPLNPVRLFRSETMREFVEQIGKGADYIVFDSPSGATFGDPLVLAENVQNVVLIHEAGKAPSEAEFEFHKALERLGINVVGMVLNKTRPQDCPAYQQYRRSYAAAIRRYHAGAERAALAPGQKAAKEKPQQYGAPEEEEEE
ncbi:MAG: polysaccharide biosynthesis tyrosine autokinase [Armatimonadetes bacterium]|nr:polysaccharide biosynthesis tyrosine autokinase [Armatimonadota bacterium]